MQIVMVSATKLSQNNRAFRSNPNNPAKHLSLEAVRSQNNRAFRSNPNFLKNVRDDVKYPKLSHKITEPSAQIPTGPKYILIDAGAHLGSQNNRAFRSNPNY